MERQSFLGALTQIDENTSVAGMKDALRILPSLVAAERAAAPLRAWLAPLEGAVHRAAERAEASARGAAAEDHALLALIGEAGAALPWSGAPRVASADPVAAAAAVSAVAARAPVLRESAKKYRMVAQSRAWGEVVSGTLSGEVEVLRTAALAGLSVPDAARARASVEAGLPALLDALSAARHARRWADRLPPQARANAEQSQARVCAEATSWLLLAWGLGVLAR